MKFQSAKAIQETILSSKYSIRDQYSKMDETSKNMHLSQERNQCGVVYDMHRNAVILVCLRMLIRRFVYGNVSKDDIHKLFPTEVLPELQRLLTLLLQKFQREWRDDLLKDQVTLPRLKAMTWDRANQDAESIDPVAVINLKLQNDAQSHSGELDMKFQLAQDTLEMMLSSMYSIRDQLPNMISDETSTRHLSQETNVM
ncbi:uncharacterized protein LOC126704338 [Quercus robur]|uniref:uncharacterized protein LOC126704338 n=1 Tax=Quercus robur TaxID=38942 RepID=UPI00216239DF|nr:uncharacterized protein LOC126704338 [Quercus robur]